MEQAIEGPTDARALQARLTMMQGPTIAAWKMSRPLRQLKQLLLKALGQGRKICWGMRQKRELILGYGQ
jgi:hypothetical protein